MPEGKLKSRSVRRVNVRVPKRKSVTHYVRKKPSKPQCAGCGANLHGVARAMHTKIKNMPKSQRRPERPYGGQLCSKCSRRTIRQKIQSLFTLK